MANFEKIRNFIHLFVICFLINISLSSELIQFIMEIPLNQYKLQNFYFRLNFSHVEIDNICEKWVPSLFSPIFFIPSNIMLRTGNLIPSSIDKIN